MAGFGWTRRAVLLAAGAGLGAGAAGLARPQMPSRAGIVPAAPPPPDPAAPLVMNDASGLSPVPVARHVVLTRDRGDVAVEALRALLAEARAEGRPLAVGAARHSMGAQSLPRAGTALTCAGGLLETDRAARTYRASGFLRWSEVIAGLDPLGLSPKVMQSNHDFGLAASFSVNAHGWPVAFGPMGSTVLALRMVLPDGTDLRVSPDENAGLFRAAMGGYGLVGIIAELEVEAEANRTLVPSFRALPAEDFGPAFAAAVREGPMAYGRLNVDRASFLTRALLCTYAATDAAPAPAQGSGLMSHAARPIFRGQVGREWMKSVRWWVEGQLGPRLAGTTTRNTLLNEPVVTLDDRDPARTDILHEYFLPPDAWTGFLEAARRLIPESYQELLNITLRWVERDARSLLSYAPDGPRIAAVLLFSQEMTARAEADMARLTRDLIAAVADLGGSYYLPYRPHATLEQFMRVYPGAAELAALKRAVDPGLVLRNGFWENYLGRL